MKLLQRTNNSVQPQRYPKIESTKSYYNLLWTTIVQICCSSSMQLWNTLPDNIRTSESLIAAFKHAIHNYCVDIFFKDETNNMPMRSNFILSHFIKLFLSLTLTHILVK